MASPPTPKAGMGAAAEEEAFQQAQVQGFLDPPGPEEGFGEGGAGEVQGDDQPDIFARR